MNPEQQSALEMIRDREVNISNLLQVAEINTSYFMECITQAFNKTPKLNDKSIDRRSVVFAVMECAKLGLVPDGKQCAIVPYKSKAVFILGYQGVVDLAYQSGAVRSIWAENVYKGDEFSWQRGLEPKIHHIPKGETSDQAEITHTYAVAKLNNGEIVFEVLTREQVEKIRSVSPARSDGPWVKWWDQMAKGKTVKRLDTYLPSTPNMKRAKEIDEVELRDDFINIPEPIKHDDDGVIIDDKRFDNAQEVRDFTDNEPDRGTGERTEEDRVPLTQSEESGSLAEEINISEKKTSNARSQSMKASHAIRKAEKKAIKILDEVENASLLKNTIPTVSEKMMEDIDELLQEIPNALAEMDYARDKYGESYNNLNANQADEFYKYLLEKING